MSLGVVGKKKGMTRLFTKEGVSIPVTVIEVLENRITCVKNLQRDGYCALQVTTGSCKQSRATKPELGNYRKAEVEPGRGLWEFRLESEEIARMPGEAIEVDIFSEGQKVDVTATSKGKGFAGVVKRWNFSTQDATHGNSLSHRAPGSIGQNQSPGRVFKGKKMAGQLGNKKITVQSLEVVKVDKQKQLLIVKGAVPGSTGADVIIRPAVKVG